MADVVIAGTSCRLPRASSYHELRNILSNNLEGQRSHSIEKDKVDINSFNIHPHQAENMDPQIRIILHCAYEALVDSCLLGSFREKYRIKTLLLDLTIVIQTIYSHNRES